ncbi:MAG: hypothetical protein SPJ27_00440 [Candidatus Onthovivens sp.]|nr:hypothetical protein [Candidatus Onthovivens sp.]
MPFLDRFAKTALTSSKEINFSSFLGSSTTSVFASITFGASSPNKTSIALIPL